MWLVLQNIAVSFRNYLKHFLDQNNLVTVGIKYLVLERVDFTANIKIYIYFPVLLTYLLPLPCPDT